MPTTPKRALPYPGATEAPDGPYSFQRLAEAVDADLDLLFSRPFGHMGRTAGFQSLNTSTYTAITMTTAQVLKGGMTYAANKLTVPRAGLYRLTVQGMFSGAVSDTNLAIAYLNTGTVEIGAPAATAKPGSADQRASAVSCVQLAAGDTIGLQAKSAAQAWGTSGYDGAYLELEWIMP